MRVHHLVGLSRILLLDRDEDQVVKDPFRRHVIVDDFGNRQLEQRKKDAFCGVSEVEVFHRRTPDDGRWKNRRSPHRDRGDVHLRIEIRERIKPRVIAERPSVTSASAGSI